MAGRGPAKNPDSVRNRNRNTAPKMTKLDGAGIPQRLVKSDRPKDELPGFDLPDGALGTYEHTTRGGNSSQKSIPWHPITLKWWEAWRRSPLADQMLTETDWYFHLGTALIHHQMWTNQRWDFAAEVRLREKEMGATPLARKSLNVDIDVPNSAPTGNGNNSEDKNSNVVDINDRFDRLTGS